MRRADHLLELEAADGPAGGGSSLEDVERRAGDVARRGWPSASAASSTMPPRAQFTMRTPVLHARDALAADEAARLGGERRVDGDEVGAREQLVERHQLDAQARRGLRRDEGIEGDHLHAQPEGALGDDGADVAEADDAEHLVAHLGADASARAATGRRAPRRRPAGCCAPAPAAWRSRARRWSRCCRRACSSPRCRAWWRRRRRRCRRRCRRGRSRGASVGALEHLGGHLRAAADDERVVVARCLAQSSSGVRPGPCLDLEVGLLARASEPLGPERVG